MAEEREVIVRLQIPDMKKLTESVTAVNKEIAKLKTSITVKPKLDMTEVNKQLEGLQSTFAKSLTINLRIGNISEIEREIENITKNVNIKINNSSASSTPRSTSTRRSTTISKPTIVYDDPADFSGPLFDIGGKAAKQDRFEYIMRREAFLKRYEKFADEKLLNIPVRVDRRLHGTRVGVTKLNSDGVPREIVFNDLKGINNRVFEHEMTHGYRIDTALASKIFSNVRWEKSDIPGMSTFVGDNPDYSNYPKIEKLAKYIETKHYKSPVDSLKEVIAELTGLYDEDPAKALGNFRNIRTGYLRFLPKLKQETILDIVSEFGKLMGDDSPIQSVTRKHLSDATNIGKYIAASQSALSGNYGNVGSKYMGRYTDPVTLPGLYDTRFPSSSNPRTFGSNLPAVITNPFPLVGRGNQNPIGNLPPIPAGAAPPWQPNPGGHQWWDTDAIRHTVNQYELTFRTQMKDQEEFIKQMDTLQALVPAGMNVKHVSTATEKDTGTKFASVKLVMRTTADQIVAFQKILPDILNQVGMQSIYAKDNLSGINKYRTLFNVDYGKDAYGIGKHTKDLFANKDLSAFATSWAHLPGGLLPERVQKKLFLDYGASDLSRYVDPMDQFRVLTGIPHEEDKYKKFLDYGASDRSKYEDPMDQFKKHMGVPHETDELDALLNFGASDRSSYDDPMAPFKKQIGVAKPPDKDPKDIAKGHLEIIDAYKKSAGTFGTISWRFTSMAMGALGVYFSISGIVMQMQRGIGMITGPLGNAEATIKGLAMARAKGFDVDGMLKNMGVSMGDIVDASMKYQGIMGMINGALAALGAKLFKDEDTWKNIVKIVEGLVNIITDPGVFEGLKSLIQSFADSMPQILEVTRLIIGGFAFLAKIPLALPVTLMLLAISAAFMPILSMISAVFSLAASWKIAGAAVEEYKVKCLLANQVMQTGSWSAQAKLGTMGAVNAGVGRNWGAISKGLKYGVPLAIGGVLASQFLMPPSSAASIEQNGGFNFNDGSMSIAGQEGSKPASTKVSASNTPAPSVSGFDLTSLITDSAIGVISTVGISMLATKLMGGGAGLGTVGGMGGGTMPWAGTEFAGMYGGGTAAATSLTGPIALAIGGAIASYMGGAELGKNKSGTKDILMGIADIISPVGMFLNKGYESTGGKNNATMQNIIGNAIEGHLKKMREIEEQYSPNVDTKIEKSNKYLSSISTNTLATVNSMAGLYKAQLLRDTQLTSSTNNIGKFAPYLNQDIINKTNKAGVTPSVNNGVTSWDTGSVSYPTNPFTGPINVNGTSTKVGDTTYYTGYDGRTYTEDQWKALPGDSPAKQKPNYTGNSTPKWQTTMNDAVAASNKALTNTWDRSNIPQWQIDHDNAIKAQTGQNGVTTGDTGWEGVKRVTQTVGDYQKVLADIAKQQLEEQKAQTEATEKLQQLQEKAYSDTLKNSGFTKNKDGSWTSHGPVQSAGDKLLAEMGAHIDNAVKSLKDLTKGSGNAKLITAAKNAAQYLNGGKGIDDSVFQVMSDADLQAIIDDGRRVKYYGANPNYLANPNLMTDMNTKYGDLASQYTAQVTANGAQYYADLKASLDAGLITQDTYDKATGKLKYDTKTGTYVQSLAVGGTIMKEGLFNLHAGEAVTPAKDVGKQGMTINVTIQGNASKDVTDDMIRRIKRELMGMGA